MGRGSIEGKRVLLALPQTYMNASGEAVLALCQKNGIDPSNLCIVYDEIDLPLGTLRMRARGSAGGHRGIASILSSLGTSEVPRLRVGVRGQRYVKGERAAGRDIDVPNLAASFQEAIVDVQVTKTIEAARRTGVERVLMGGGVVANTRLRARLVADGSEAGLEVLVPSLALCTDNAAMVACLGAARLERGDRSGLDIAADPNLPLAL